MKVVKTGPWRVTQATLIGLPVAFTAAYRKALKQEAEFLKGKMVSGIHRQAPGGRPFKPPAASTLALRRMQGRTGTKALLDRHELVKSFVGIQRGDQGFAGVLNSSRDSEGKRMTSILEKHENGATIVMTLTTAQRRFLAAQRNGSGTSSGGTGSGAVVVRIPPRPVIQPVHKKYATGMAFRERMKFRIGFNMGGQLGTVAAAGFNFSGDSGP